MERFRAKRGPFRLAVSVRSGEVVATLERCDPPIHCIEQVALMSWYRVVASPADAMRWCEQEAARRLT
jgi:hypothetical protein